MRALLWSALINGVAAGPLIIAMGVLVSLRSVMGSLVLPTWLRVLGWASGALMVGATAGLFCGQAACSSGGAGPTARQTNGARGGIRTPMT
jgi:Mn2+/Fe2+ NRAMP family transporter